eukprot:CAMPEP_0172409442 /NCGR_PEP_ID=MMETSP1061-20121228/76369_1 /TAXON_ID=37318 /ORGANISM="Pseudo-nitzschia pungens, Strain cf. pungens" /LENGTH=1620 /DNA_ID=CAMNT_0013145597 /DNA_START=1731 /DNA_END=6593 /DNA_ORIENTATION=+
MGGKRIVKIKEEDGSNRLLKAGMPDYTRCDNTLITSKYNFFNFVPINIKNQFRRFANMYFLIIGLIMWVGTNYPHLFMSAFSPYTTWGPIFLFVSISIFGEAMADRKRHKSDYITNTFRCVVVENETADPTPVSESVTNKMERSMVNVSKRNRRQSIEADQDARHDMPGDYVDIDPVRPGIHGPTTAIFRPIQRKDIRQGHIIVVKNREMIPADMVLLASSGDRGCAYIETSSIDGETNLKLRVSAKHKTDPGYSKHHETIEEAVERIAGFSVLGCPKSALDDEDYIKDRVAELMTEPPDAHINTFTGLLTFPALPETDDLENGGGGGAGDSATKGSKRTLPLGAENLLMRGSVLRNTEWAIGLICFTGTDTKISQNTVESPAKFSQLDLITNKCVIVMVFVELACIAYLSTTAVWINEQNIDKLWYAGRKVPGDTESPWPYLPDLAVPEWSTRGQSWIQYAMTNITLLSYFVPLSMYLTLEVCNFFLMWLISVDQNIYDATTDTRAEPRSVTYTDLGQIQYIFSDKTGTLTQNVMRFKRCSVDGMVFGKPVAKASTKGNNGGLDGGDAPSKFLPTRQVLVGQVRETEDGKQLGKTKGMTFNAELFLRVMSLCHTVVVENDLDLPKDKDGEPAANGSFSEADAAEKAPDGAPPGYAYQAESPDEGALVSEASKTFGFQVVSRDSTGIRLRCDHPSLFSDEALVKGLKSGVIDPATVASESASGNRSFQRTAPSANDDDDNIETWSVLAINKFDSTRKRMSILLRSPPQYGSCAILLCKGADSAMIDPEICSSFGPLAALDENNAAITDNSEWESARILGLESHLGEFASEGLRTLVLGVRFLTDAQCDEWLEQFTAAATAIKGREEKLTEAALALERDLHIVGATAIEDKLQVGVPDTIATLGKAGIKLWVLTGDKRETAIEIGYSTKVLTPRMHLTEMADRGEELVRAQCAMEFLRLVKAGKLPMYQRAAVDKQEKMMLLCVVFSCFGQILALCCFSLRRMMLRLNICIRSMFGLKTRAQRQQLEAMRKETEERRGRTSDLVRRRNVRDRAEAILREYARKHPGHDEGALSTDELPTVFNRAQQAQGVLDKQRSAGKLSGVDNRALKLEQLNAQEEAQKHEAPIIDDDVISLQSFMPSDDAKNKSDFDKKKRTVLERMFAVDRDVRKGRLIKHLKKEKRKEVLSGTAISPIEPSGEGPRALVIEGAALKHLQGDHILEELVFNVASQCESVIACRVTPRQKAQLVKMVRHYVSPEPVTLAIGDGANDVGMIQAAHCGIGISGKEGQQAVNASDFSIGQFRFLEDLILYHGRWDFLRTSMVVLYTFYKNAVISFLLVLYNNETLFSGTSIFDQWMMAGFSFVCFFPILSIGMFDRNLEKNYIKKNPEVYKTTQKNELITPRTLSRWLILCLLHVGILYYGQFPQLTKHGGGRSTAFSGLMWNKPSVGDGEVSDWQTQGVTIFTSMVLVMGYKVLYESRSIINGKWPAFVGCCSTTKGGYTSRLPYTLYGILIGSFGAYAFCLSVYKAMGVFLGVSSGTWFIMFYVPDHAFLYSLYNYVLIIIIPIGAMSLDIAGKVFSNMFYPSQNQIHIELESRELQALRKGKKPSKAHSPDIETSASC